ncbi:glomulin [Monomorium pharaonis]|uniref:glomulin n=1 Tax=Monomorium pharaonis TaxID=307658 RepID=UPI00063F5847|nr:glomulin [Monomorium pharaonis]
MMSLDMMTRVFINRFIDLLDDGKTEEAIQLLKKDRKVTEDGLHNILSAVVSNLTSFTLQHKKETFDCCSNVLMYIAENYDSTTVIIEIPKHLKHASDHVNFCTILNAMLSCMMKMQNKRRDIVWGLDSILAYIKNLPLSDEVDDLEAASERIIQTYKEITVFLQLLIQEAINNNSKQKKETRFRKRLLSFLISLCEKPLCCLNKYVIEGKISETTYEELTDDIVTQAFCLTGDILYFLNVVSKRQKKPFYYKKRYKEIFQKAFISNWTMQISDMAFANFYFYIITKEKYWINVPQVYNTYYILEMCAYFFKILLSEDYSIPTGLIFMENVIKRILPRSINFRVLKLEIYTELLKPLTKVMIYSNSDEQRKKAVHIFQEYIEIFNMEAKYFVILYLYDIAEHSGLLSFITGMFKSSIIECLDSTPQNPQFLGGNMELLLKKACNLPHGSSSDVVEISDEIIAALNLLRFLFIRDKNNETGIWDMTDMLKSNYLNPLKEGIDLCRGHWKVKAKDLDQQKKDLAKEQDYSKLMKAHMEVALTVGGEQLPLMPVPEKISICYQVINGLDVMESILVRVNECIDMNEKFIKKSDELISM